MAESEIVRAFLRELKREEAVFNAQQTTVTNGSSATISYNVPAGKVFFANVPRVTSVVSTTYRYAIDGENKTSTMSEVLADISDSPIVPFGKAYRIVSVVITNNTGSTQTYNVLFSGTERLLEEEKI